MSKLTKATFKTIASDDVISASQLRDLIESETGVSLDEKTVRASLRKHFTRQIEQKGARWRIDYAIADTFVDRYEKRASSEQAAS